MTFFCSVQTESESRLTMGRYFLAVFEVYLFGNTLYMARIALNYLRLVLKRRYRKNLRSRLAREVVSKMKLINQILFAMAEQAKEDKGPDGEQEQNQSKHWLEKSWFEPVSPLHTEKDKDQKIQMQPKRTAYGGLQGTFILSESHKPLSFDHISSIRDLE